MRCRQAQNHLNLITTAGGAKLLAFAHHMTCLDAIEKAARDAKVRYVRLDGRTPSRERADSVSKFQADQEIRLAILSVTACGQGITLTASADVAFAELHWTPSVLLQAVRTRRNALSGPFCTTPPALVSLAALVDCKLEVQFDSSFPRPTACRRTECTASASRVQ